MLKKINIGLIGVGVHCEENLIPAIKLNFSSKILSIYSSNNKKIELLKHRYDIENGFNNSKDLIRDSKIDCVFISGSPDFHLATINECIEYSKPFFVEKPPLPSYNDFEELGKKLIPLNFVGYNYRYTPLLVNSLEQLTKDSTLELLKIRYITNKPTSIIWNYSSVLESYLYAVGIHAIECLMFYLGNFESISLIYHKINKDLFILDVFVKSISGKKGFLELGNYSNKLDYIIEAINSKGVILKINNLSQVEIHETSSFKYNKKEHIEYALSGSEGGYIRNGFQVEIDEFLNAVRDKKTSTTSDILNSKEVYRFIQEVLTQISQCNPPNFI